MKIESIIKRNPPTKITLGSTTYQFQPDSQGRHVCEVSDQQHIARLLGIAEGYRLPADSAECAPEPVAQTTLAQTQPTIEPVADTEEDDAEDETALYGSDVHPAVIDLGDGRTVQLGEVVQQAFAASGMTRQEWNEQDEDDRYAKIDAALDAMVAPQQEDTDGKDDGNTASPEGEKDDQPKLADDLTRDELADLYEAKFDKRPHGKWSADRISEELKKDAE